jgi:hypothetical protein
MSLQKSGALEGIQRGICARLRIRAELQRDLWSKQFRVLPGRTAKMRFPQSHLRRFSPGAIYRPLSDGPYFGGHSPET